MEPVQAPRVFSSRYELTHLIARGGMAQVYRARDQLLDRPVAIKVLFPELSVDRAFVERFRREAQAAANLSHPNIVPVFDWGEDNGTYFIVMEFVDGRPLSALLRASGPLPPERTADIGAHVAAALAYAHKHGVVHRDVKPGNVLITDDGNVKVTDFGIARAVNTEDSLTQTGAVMGTAAYFSPEQAEGVGVDARSDIYSLGVVLFEMCTGRPPFLGETPVAVASKHVRDQPPLPRELNASVPPALEAVVMKAMTKAPEGRYQTADELRADLLRYAEGRPVTAGDPGATTAVLGAATAGTTRVLGATGGRTQVVPLEEAAPAEEEDDAARRQRTRRLVIVLVVLLVALAIVAFFLLRSLGYLGGGSSFSMPNVVGESQAQAVSTLKAKGLTISNYFAVPSKTYAKGTVSATDPKAGASVSKGQGVTLDVSSGSPGSPVTVPDVTGKDLAVAEQILNNAGLRYRVRFVQSNDVSQNGQVLSQNPVGQETVDSGTTVTLTVAETGNNVAVPNVTGDTPSQAGQALGAQGLTVGTQTMACSNSIGNGLVSSSNPASGASVAKGTAVALTVSTGPCQVVVQSVVGLSQSQASSTLSGQGLTPSPVQTSNCSASQNGTVVSQNPIGGTSVQNGSTVTITVCNNTGPPSKPVPNVVGDTLSAATAALSAQGFTNVVTTGPSTCPPMQVSTVTAQNPSSGNLPTSTQISLTLVCKPSTTTTT